MVYRLVRIVDNQGASNSNTKINFCKNEVLTTNNNGHLKLTKRLRVQSVWFMMGTIINNFLEPIFVGVWENIGINDSWWWFFCVLTTAGVNDIIQASDMCSLLLVAKPSGFSSTVCNTKVREFKIIIIYIKQKVSPSTKKSQITKFCIRMF